MTQPIPPGYSQYVTKCRRLLLLPDSTIKAIQQTIEKSASDIGSPDAEPAEDRTVAKRHDRIPEFQLENRAWRDVFGDQAPAGFLRVVHGFDSLNSDRWREQQAGRSGDQDEQRRIRTLLDKLVTRGPDRRIGQPRDWRASLDELERLLPHFRRPLGIVGNALALSEASATPVRIPPMLLVGPPGIGKTMFTHRLSQALGVPSASIAFDQANAGSQLFGSDKYWSNTQCGLLFQLLCEGEVANPVILLDEIDKAAVGSSGSRALDPLAQLHGALETQTARQARDVSTDIEFDASLVTYVATANSLRGMGLPLLSRFEVFAIDPPTKGEAVDVARHIVEHVSSRLGLVEPISFERRCLYVLAHMSPRLMVRTVDKAVAEAVAQKRQTVSEQDVWRLSGLDDDSNQTH